MEGEKDGGERVMEGRERWRERGMEGMGERRGEKGEGTKRGRRSDGRREG